jgi:hypothetical protein
MLVFVACWLTVRRHLRAISAHWTILQFPTLRFLDAMAGD